MNPSATSPTNNTKSQKPTDNSTPEASKPVEAAGKPADPKTAAPTTESTTPKDSKSAKKAETKKVLSVSFPGKTVRQLKLLASVEGVSLASIVVASVTRTVSKRLPAALEALKGDLEG